MPDQDSEAESLTLLSSPPEPEGQKTSSILNTETSIDIHIPEADIMQSEEDLLKQCKKQVRICLPKLHYQEHMVNQQSPPDVWSPARGRGFPQELQDNARRHQEKEGEQVQGEKRVHERVGEQERAREWLVR